MFLYISVIESERMNGGTGKEYMQAREEMLLCMKECKDQLKAKEEREKRKKEQLEAVKQIKIKKSVDVEGKQGSWVRSRS